MNPQSQIAMRNYRPAGFGCVAISATPATAVFFAAPQRVFVILTEADQAAMAAAGQREPGTGRWFGDTRLLLLSPQ